ncbi:MAG: hypothetical protein JEZ10_08485 [Verrucomicrobia bacterium]|nr:hypothetical protein [Verrucomicrobiota bacterium]
MANNLSIGWGAVHSQPNFRGLKNIFSEGIFRNLLIKSTIHQLPSWARTGGGFCNSLMFKDSDFCAGRVVPARLFSFVFF